MNKTLIAIGAVLSSALASVCCLGPIVLVGLGIGGAGLAAGLSQYRHFFLCLTTVLLGIAFYLTYRKRKVTCEDGRCELESGSKPMKRVLWIVTVAALGFATFPHWSTIALRKAVPVEQANMETVQLAIAGMSCTACAVSIQKSLKKVAGVETAFVDFKESKATVQVHPGKVEKDVLIRAVQTAGNYTAKIEEN
ncbi:MAG: cation transporter [Elusimicrobia bacterium]|nr:cation transporter [Elusimicrobiota bacterium]